MDLPSAFLQTPMDPKDLKVHMALQGKLTELMVKFDPKLYRKLFSNDGKGRIILYVEIQKVLYGMLKSALMFYLGLLVDMTRSNFKINPYDPYMMNKLWGGGI